MKIIKPRIEVDVVDRDDVLRKIEYAGRVCYQSQALCTEYSASKFVERLVRMGHESVLEHVSITAKITCDRGVSHELVRHRLASYSQESTRYVAYKNHVTFICPPWIEFGCDDDTTLEIDSHALLSGDLLNDDEPGAIWLQAMARAERCYHRLLDSGWKPEQARSVLPNSVKTEVVITANLREWRHILSLRASKYAHPQIREISIPLLEHFNTVLPEVFYDIYEEVQDDEEDSDRETEDKDEDEE